MTTPDIDALLDLLKESKREHDHCDDSWYCCGACRHPDHKLADGEHVGMIPIGVEIGIEPGTCTCGAAEWNKKVDREIRHFGCVEVNR